MTAAARFRINTERGGRTLEVGGDWTALTIGSTVAALHHALDGTSGELRIDISELGRIDTAGIYAILSAAPEAKIDPNAPPRADIDRLLELVRPAAKASTAPAPPAHQRILERIGRGVVGFWEELLRACDFAGRLFVALGRSITHPSHLRGISVVHAMETTGAGALPIVFIMNFFIGAVVALVGASLLTSLGVGVFTVQLVGVAVLREFGALITAIILAGRSASSFAAQIGSMKMNQETDAMQVMGVDQFDALVVPRVIAMLWMMPLLTFAAMFAGILGGLLVSWGALGISPVFFLERMQDSVSIRHFWIGISKTPLLALLIAMAGCRHGLSVGGDVESLGSRVTAAVVQAIFMIILFDAVFAVIYMKLKL
jgi:phospholipid/cholesterol/gamma-HCH transport system permease protein